MTNCHIYRCRNLETRCKDCGRLVNTAKLDDGWISVRDKLPNEEEDYLTLIMDNGCSIFQKVQRFYKIPKVLKGIYADSVTRWELETWDDNIVTHWMPLPHPPGYQDDNQNDNQVER